MKKEANLISSPVLREFYNKAIENKWITEEKIEKTASNMNKYAVSGNLVQDLVALAFGLRELGLFEQAESLETKINLFKKADVALSNLIDDQSRALQEAAHAENTKIVDAQNGWGVVHTNMDRQRKILETLTHQPQARMENAFKVDLSKAMENSVNPAVKNIALSAADALGLLKLAQENKSRVLLTENEIKNRNGLISYINDTVVPAANTNVENINKGISDLKSYFMKLNKSYFLTKTATDTNYSDYAFISGVKEDQMKSSFKAFIDAFGNVETIDESVIEQQIRGKDYKTVYDNMNNLRSKGLITSTTFNTYFHGTKMLDTADKSYIASESDEAAALTWMYQSQGRTEFRPNSNSIWSGDLGLSDFFSKAISFDAGPYLNENVSNAAAAVVKEIEDKLNSYFVADINTNFAAVESQINAIKAPLQGITDLSKLKSDDITSNVIYVQKLTEAKTSFTSAVIEFNKKNKKLSEIIASQASDLSSDKLISGEKSISSQIDQQISEITTKHPVTNRDEPDDDKKSLFNSAAVNLVDAREIYAKASKDEKDEKIKENASNVYKLLDVIIAGIGKIREYGASDSMVQNFLGDQEFFTINDLAEYASQAISVAKTEFPNFAKGKGAGFFNTQTIIKSAVPAFKGVRGGKPGTVKPVAAKGGGGKAKSDSKYEAAQLTEGQKSVQLMQYALSYLGGFLSTNPATRSDASIIMTVGKTGEDLSSFDAKWKANVAQSLTTAKKYVKDITQVGPDSVFGKNDMLMKSAADDNFNKIIRFLAQQGVQVPGINMAAVKIDYDFDKIPELFGNLDRDKGLIDSTGDIEVKKSHLVSLSAFYNFVNSSMDSFDAEDSTIQEWHDLLTWLWNRSKRKAERFGSTLEKRVFAQYHGFCDALWQKFNRKLQELGIPEDQWSQIVLSPEEFVSLRIKGFGGGTGRAGAEGPEGRRRRRKGRGAGEVEEESDYLGSEGEDYDEETAKRSLYPFTKDKIYFNLLDPEGNPWFDLDNFPQFKGTIFFFRGLGDPMTTANKYFRSSKMSPAEVEEHYVQNYLTGLPTESIDGRYYYTEVSTGRKQPVSRLPEFRKLYPVISSQGQLEEYMKFLTFLLDALDDVAARSKQYVMSASNLSSNKREQVAASLESAHDRWVRELNRSLRNYNRISA